ncbi:MULTISPECIES: hypothetical protein [unclassified Microbacterium]|uniref:hypothetical protein n=1 Tax=unclassified Microbacterium TaxID=2609290 RepID=UPI0030180AD7
MTDRIIPAAVKLAAKRAAVKTAAQSARGAGAAVVAAIGASVLGVDWMLVAGVAGAGVVTVVWAGADAYLDKIRNGIPVEYTDATLVEQATLTEDAQLADQEAAVSRVLRRDPRA